MRVKRATSEYMFAHDNLYMLWTGQLFTSLVFFPITAAALLGQAGGGLLPPYSVEIVPDPITLFLGDISGGGHIFRPAPSWLSEHSLPLTGHQVHLPV